MTSQISYPIAELFESIQGEGFHSGVPMHFIRLAGCSVGKPYRKCKSYLGFEFTCDTEYKMKEQKKLSELLNWCQGANHVCITGGEPFDHNLMPLLDGLLSLRIKPHVETSGTKMNDGIKIMTGIWITLSPKEGLIEKWRIRSNELKWLVHYKHPITDVDQLYHRSEGRTFVQPVWDDEYKLNLHYAIDLVKRFKGLRLSLQTHKWAEIR